MAQTSSTNWFDHTAPQLAVSKVAVFGDFCVDAYWHIDPDPSELSLETGLPVRRVTQQQYSLGGAGNVVVNLQALQVQAVHAVGMVGNDLFGALMLKMLTDAGADITGMCAADDWQTMVYAKPHVDQEEQNRIDFGAFNELSTAAVDQLMTSLAQAAAQCPMVVLNQQVAQGLSTPPVIERINQVIADHPKTRFIVDARHHAAHYRNVILKLNVYEAARLTGRSYGPHTHVPVDQVKQMASAFAQKTGLPVFITRGAHGLVVADGAQTHVIPGIQVMGQTDPVGAGDTIVAALAASLAGGAQPLAAAQLANIAASITVRKLHTTGSAGVEELRQASEAPEYIYEPELAEEARLARHVDGSEIELVRDLPDHMAIRHAIFDHDGTISTLREGWEAIMEPMMLRAILGPRHADADARLYNQVRDAVRQFIDQTTGVQTLVQMHGLVDMVRRFGCVAEDDILDAVGYKRVYNDALLEHVNARLAKFERGELHNEDFQLKGARQLLDHLHAKGVALYLASGTDTDDVKREAEALSYAHLFAGGIYGAVGDVTVETKRMVMRQIIREHRLDGPQFATFGDGPVEMRASRQCGGVAVGIASDEVRRYGLNTTKRTRLIRAGADIIIPDFSQAPALLKLLGVD